MRLIHLARKPLGESSTGANLIKHGTGAVHIDACRIGTADDVPSVHATRRSDYPQSYEGKGPGWGRTRGGYAGDVVAWEPTGGRWPANLILEHLPSCQQAGVRKVKSHNPDNKVTAGGASTGEVYGDYAKRSLVGHADPDGTETIAAWLCAPGCPVEALDEQSGDLPTQRTRTNPGAASSHEGMFGVAKVQKNGPEYLGEQGGASRFFKQVGGSK